MDFRNRKVPMKNYAFILFFTIVLALYALINFYLIRQGLSVMAPESSWRIVWTCTVVFLSASFVAGRILERRTRPVH